MFWSNMGPYGEVEVGLVRIYPVINSPRLIGVVIALLPVDGPLNINQSNIWGGAHFMICGNTN